MMIIMRIDLPIIAINDFISLIDSDVFPLAPLQVIFYHVLDL